MTDYERIKSIVKCLIVKIDKIEKKLDHQDDLLGELICECAGDKYDIKKLEELLNE